MAPRHHRLLDAAGMRRALGDLDARLASDVRLVIGGGAAMVLAYDHALATQDIDAFAKRGSPRVSDLDSLAKQTARALDIEPDWLNAHFETFTHVLPADYATRLREVFAGHHLAVEALGPEDILVMKCFAARDKDRPHAIKLMRLARDLAIVDRQLALLVDKHVPGAATAADYFDDLRDELAL